MNLEEIMDSKLGTEDMEPMAIEENLRKLNYIRQQVALEATLRRTLKNVVSKNGKWWKNDKVSTVTAYEYIVDYYKNQIVIGNSKVSYDDGYKEDTDKPYVMFLGNDIAVPCDIPLIREVLLYNDYLADGKVIRESFKKENYFGEEE